MSYLVTSRIYHFALLCHDIVFYQHPVCLQHKSIFNIDSNWQRLSEFCSKTKVSKLIKINISNVFFNLLQNIVIK